MHRKTTRPWFVSLILATAGWCIWVGVGDVAFAAQPTAQSQAELANQAYRLAVECIKDEVHVVLEDKQMGLRVADGPYLYRAARAENEKNTPYQGLKDATVKVSGERLTICGKLAGLDIEHVFELPVDRAIMEERIIVHNGTDRRIGLSSFEMGLVRLVTDKAGQVLPELAADRFVAVPFRARPDDAKSYYNDFSVADLINNKGYDICSRTDGRAERIPADRRQSEGWAWTHGARTLGIFKFDQENMQWSVLATGKGDRGREIRFGGACMIDGEPSDLGRIPPGQTVRLGVTHFQTLPGGYENAMYAFRTFLDEKSCRLPKGFDPPVHWEQLYDMEGAWDDRPHRYTKAIVEKEAAKGVEYSCEALYLDPGWDTDFATFLWGEQWLGPRKAFVEEMQAKYGLKVSLHTPLASWMSVGWPMGGNTAPATYPPAARRKAPRIDPDAVRVPAGNRGRRNLALLPSAKANASSVWADGAEPSHQVSHLNDGWYSDQASWVAKTREAWAEIDLGDVYTVSLVRLSSDNTRAFGDRNPASYRILVATQYAAESSSAVWKSVADVSNKPFATIREFFFAPCEARWVRVQILKSHPNEPRLDEIQVYEDKVLPEPELQAWESQARRAPSPPDMPSGFSTICLGSKAYLDEATKRLLANCADGVVYLMYDGNCWQGGCEDPTHGHPVPFTKEDHMRANLDLAQRIHEKYPNVLIEMHDMLVGGNRPRNTPVYYKYGLPKSYDENWGFELMWDPMDDIVAGRARSLYYYNLGCNVPVYLHIDLRKDKVGCPVLWWYASTCRHLGIGGTHKDPEVVAAHKAAMRTYHKLQRFFKRGEFYGAGEDVHLHVLPEENAFVVNLFNLSDEKRAIGGSIALGQMGLKGRRLEPGSPDANSMEKSAANDRGSLENGVWTIHREMAPWSTEVIHVRVSE